MCTECLGSRRPSVLPQLSCAPVPGIHHQGSLLGRSQPRLCLPGTCLKNAITAGPEASALPLPTWRLWEGDLCPPGLTDAFPGTGLCSRGCGAGPQRAPRKVCAEIDGWSGSGLGRSRGGQRVDPGELCPGRVLCLPSWLHVAGQSSEKVQDEGLPSKASPKGSHLRWKQHLEHRGWACHMTAMCPLLSRPSPGLLQPRHPRFQFEKLSPDPVDPLQ